MAHIEREIKLGLTPQAFARLSRLAPQRRSVASVYFDTARHELRRAGIALRLRRDGKRWLQTLKAESAPHAGLAARAEWELPVRGKALEPDAFPHQEILNVTGIELARVARRLRPVFETRFMRRSGMLQLGDRTSAELCIDRGQIVAGARRESLNEVELELVSGSTLGMLRFAEALALPLAYESKAERGYRLASGLPRAPRKWRMPKIDAGEPAGKAFAAVFSAALMQAGINAAGMLASRDPEYLHQLRVGLRRLRSSLRAFAPVIPDASPIRGALRRLMPALGAARDWDVFPQVAGRVRGARGRAEAARRKALATIRSAEFQGFLFRCLRWLQAEPWGERNLTLQHLAPGRLDVLLRKAVAAFDCSSARRRHKLRIRIKRLRYACEFFAPCFASPASDAYVQQLAELQDLLGELNDIAVARRLLRRMQAAAPPALDAREKKLIGAVRAAWQRFERRGRYWRPPA